MDKGKIFKYIIGAGFVIGGMSYIYYNYIRGKFSFSFFSCNKKNENKTFNNFINIYLEKIKSKISLLPNKTNWIYNKKILCHINYLVNEIIYDIKHNNNIKNNFQNDYELKLFIYQNIMSKYFEIDFTDMIPFINDNLILLPDNKDFIPLERHDESNIKEIMKENDEQKIEDSFFFASVKQIELDKLLSNIFDYENNEEMNNTNNKIVNSDKFHEIIKFKQSFKKEFIERYNFDSKYLMDVYYYLHNKKNGESTLNSKEDIYLLINKIVY